MKSASDGKKATKRAPRAAATTPPPRVPLTRERLVQAAIALADAGGLEGLSMRKLADELGVVPMAPYKHLASKDALLDAMVDVVFAEVALSRGGRWRAALRERAIAMRKGLSRHPWAIGIMESRATGPANLRHHDATMACLREQAGLPMRTAIHAYSVMDAYIYGFVLQEQTLPFETPEQSAEVAAKKLQALEPSVAPTYPYLVEVAAELAKSGYDYDEEFAFGLDLILDGIARLRK